MKIKIVHIIEIQYFMGYTTNSKNTYMHDLKASYEEVSSILNPVAKENFAFGQNHRFYPNPPVMSDLKIVSPAIMFQPQNVDSGPLRPPIPEEYDPPIRDCDPVGELSFRHTDALYNPSIPLRK